MDNKSISAFKSISTQTLQRLPIYLNYLKGLPEDRAVNISATAIAEAVGLNDVQVRKDLALVSEGGRPKIGYITDGLIKDIERFLGYNNTDSAVIVGAGNLGKALMSYEGFKEYGLDIIAGFDIDEKVVGTNVNGKLILPFDKLGDLCERMNVRIGIISVPAIQAQKVCDILIKHGVLAIWNFAPTHLCVPENVLVQNENMASSLAVLSNHLTEKLLENSK